MKKGILFFIFFIFLFSSIAQVPGYMGKRGIIGYSTYFMFAPKGSGPFNANPKGELSPTLNNVHCLNLEYVYHERRMVCFSGQYLITGLAYDNGNRSEFGNIFTTITDTPYPRGYKYSGDYSKPALLRSFNISMGLKMFRKGFVAPVGRYRKMEGLILFEKVRYDYKNFAKADPNSSFSEPPYIKTDYGVGEYSFINFSFAYSFGCQRVLNDKIILDFGIRFAITPQFNIISIAASEEYVNSPESYYKHESNSRIMRQQAINFHLGIGFLAF